MATKIHLASVTLKNNEHELVSNTDTLILSEKYKDKEIKKLKIVLSDKRSYSFDEVPTNNLYNFFEYNLAKSFNIKYCPNQIVECAKIYGILIDDGSIEFDKYIHFNKVYDKIVSSINSKLMTVFFLNKNGDDDDCVFYMNEGCENYRLFLLSALKKGLLKIDYTKFSNDEKKEHSI